MKPNKNTYHESWKRVFSQDSWAFMKGAVIAPLGFLFARKSSICKHGRCTFWGWSIFIIKWSQKHWHYLVLVLHRHIGIFEKKCEVNFSSILWPRFLGNGARDQGQVKAYSSVAVWARDCPFIKKLKHHDRNSTIACEKVSWARLKFFEIRLHSYSIFCVQLYL